MVTPCYHFSPLTQITEPLGGKSTVGKMELILFFFFKQMYLLFLTPFSISPYIVLLTSDKTESQDVVLGPLKYLR